MASTGPESSSTCSIRRPRRPYDAKFTCSAIHHKIRCTYTTTVRYTSGSFYFHIKRLPQIVADCPPACAVCRLPYMMSTNTVRVMGWTCWACGSWKKCREVKDVTVGRRQEEDEEEDQREVCDKCRYVRDSACLVEWGEWEPHFGWWKGIL